MPASVTFAHEFNHLLQQNYDSFQDLWMFESTAVWAEEKVYPQINDYLNYVRAFASFPGAPLTTAYPPEKRKSLKIYGSAVWNHWLDTGGGGYGAGAIRRAWEVSDVAKPRDFSLAAYDRAISRGGRAQLQPRVRLVRRGDRRVARRARQLPRPRHVPGREAQGLAAPRHAASRSRSSTRRTGCSRSSPAARTTRSASG